MRDDEGVPANVTPEYKAAEAAYKTARDPAERLQLLREMLRAIPKHKGTEHLQADIKTRIKDLTDQLTGPRKGGARTGPATVIRPEGAAQIALVGPPNSGKSALHAALTHSHAVSKPYPFTTQYPLPGMMPFEDVGLQLIDLPPISVTHPVRWIRDALQPADGCLLVVDLTRPGCTEEMVALGEALRDRNVLLSPDWGPAGQAAGEGDPFTKILPAVLVAAKVDDGPEPAAEAEALQELAGSRYPVLAVSANTGRGLENLARWLVASLGIVRVYTKIPGMPPDRGRPYTVRRGQTVGDVAAIVHREIAARLKYARIWGRGTIDGQQVGRDHVVADGDIVELHS
ncbi:MAG: TGS domain-containing protein [Acidimicrobiia bacterium]